MSGTKLANSLHDDNGDVGEPQSSLLYRVVERGVRKFASLSVCHNDLANGRGKVRERFSCNWWCAYSVETSSRRGDISNASGKSAAVAAGSQLINDLPSVIHDVLYVHTTISFRVLVGAHLYLVTWNMLLWAVTQRTVDGLRVINLPENIMVVISSVLCPHRRLILGGRSLVPRYLKYASLNFNFSSATFLQKSCTLKRVGRINTQHWWTSTLPFSHSTPSRSVLIVCGWQSISNCGGSRMDAEVGVIYGDVFQNIDVSLGAVVVCFSIVPCRASFF